MKKIFALILAALMLISAASCDTAQTTQTKTGGENTVTGTSDTITSGKETEEKPLFIPQGVFSAGFAREDITPDLFPVPMNSTAKADNAHDPLYLTCVAVADGDEVALFFHADLKKTLKSVYESVARQIEEELGIPADHIFITATHTHNAPEQSMAGASPYVVRWMQAILYPAFRKAAKDAYRDLSEAKFYGGTADTTGYAFVRRYICADGSFDGINYAYPTGSPAVRHETEADPQLQVLKITREGKKDVVMVNWQAHVAHAAGTYKASVSSDFVHYLRAGVEGQMGVQFAYYNGASGNLNLSTRFPELRKYSGSTWIDVGKALVSKVKEACSNVTELKTGEIKVATGEVEGVFREVDAARLAQAREYNYASSDAERAAVLAKYKFHSRYEASKIVELGSKTTDSEKISLYAITFGEIAFAGAPYEMFDTSGMEIKNASPYKMTFICAYTNGAQGYMPSFDAFSRGGYEVHVANYVQGTAEKCVTELLRLLQAVA